MKLLIAKNSERAAHALGADARDAANDEGSRCPHCDGTGDVHRADGEWLGRCTCEAGREPGELIPEDVDAEVRRLEADAHRNYLKNSGEGERRRVEWYAQREVEQLRRDGRLA